MLPNVSLGTAARLRRIQKGLPPYSQYPYRVKLLGPGKAWGQYETATGPEPVWRHKGSGQDGGFTQQTMRVFGFPQVRVHASLLAPPGGLGAGAEEGSDEEDPFGWAASGFD